MMGSNVLLKEYAMSAFARRTLYFATCVVIGMSFPASAQGQASKPPPKAKLMVADAMDAGVAYLRQCQLKSGSWGGSKNIAQVGVAGTSADLWRVGYAALPGIAILEVVGKQDDPAVLKAARFVRENVENQTRTYELALALLFLKKLGNPADETRIRKLSLRLAAGQRASGGWGYHCPLLTPDQQKKFVADLELRERENAPPLPFPSGDTDNSNTQFAILGLWDAKKYDLPLTNVLARINDRFRTDQRPGGWSYKFGNPKPAGAMTCVGLLALAVGHGVEADRARAAKEGTGVKVEDPAITSGLKALATYLDDPSDRKMLWGTDWTGPKGATNYYFLWSVERVGVLLGLETIGGRDWYAWGRDLLLRDQRKDGSWFGRGSGNPIVDTCFALLFLKRSDLLPELRETLQARLKIVDPGLVSPGSGVKEKAEEEMVFDLGDLQPKKTVKRTIRITGPQAFTILGTRTDDQYLLIEHGQERRATHEVTLTLSPDAEGPFLRRIYFKTDLPGRSEIAVKLEARVAAR